MKKIALFFCSILLTLISNAQVNFQWAKSIGGSYPDNGNSIALDGLGNVYVTGYFYGSVDFDPGVGIYNLNSALSFDDIFILKLDASGNFVWAKNVGATGGAHGNSIAIDGSGNVYTTGYFNGTGDFDPGAGSYTLTSFGSSDVFVSKLTTSGAFVWAKQFGGVNLDNGSSLTVDASNNVYITGNFNGTVDFDPGAGIYNLTSILGSDDIFITKLNTLGNFVYAKTMGGSDIDNGNAITVDGSGNVYTTGSFRFGGDFDPGVATYNLTSNGIDDIFVSKLDATGNFVWAKSMGGSNWDYGYSITLDITGNVYSTGSFNGTSDFDPSVGVYTLATTGTFSDHDIFVSKLDASGNFVWAKQMGGPTNADIGLSISLDALGNIYTTGMYLYTGDFDPGLGTYTLTSLGSAAGIFISKLDVSGNFVWARGMGSGGDAYGQCIVLDITASSIYTTGRFRGTTDLDPGAGVYNLTPNGGFDILIHKMGQSPLGIEEVSKDNNLNAYPNPSSGSFKVKIENDLQNGELVLYNSIGQKVYEQKITHGVNDIDILGMSTGLYNCILLNDNQKINSGKITIE